MPKSTSSRPYRLLLPVKKKSRIASANKKPRVRRGLERFSFFVRSLHVCCH